MTTSQVYWISKLVVIEWTITDLDGAPVTDATVTGTITLPDETTAAATISQTGNTYRAAYDPTSAGRHTYRLLATGTADSAAEGVFDVRPSPEAAPPPALDTTTDVGKVRVLIPDRDLDLLLLSDAEIEVFLGLVRGTGNPRLLRAAASALETIASSEALVSKKLRDKDVATDGPAVAKELRERAAQLRAQADDDEDNDLADGGGLDIVDFRDPFHRAWPAEATEWESY